MSQTDSEEYRLTPLDTLLDAAPGVEAPLPPALAALYGRLAFPVAPIDGAATARPWVISNFVASLDGVVAFTDPTPPGKGEVSAGNGHDRAVMGLLRAAADAVVVGAGTLRAVPRHRWTPDYIFPPFAAEYAALRAALGLAPTPLTVIVSAGGALDRSLPIFQRGELPAALLTTPAGAARLAGAAVDTPFGPNTLLRAIEPTRVAGAEEDAEEDADRGDSLSARAVVEATVDALRTLGLTRDGEHGAGAHSPRILVEGGPRLLARFALERLLDEQFLTIAPQLAGRDDAYHRPGLIEGQRLAPDHPRWGRLVSARRGVDDSFLFLRYSFAQTA